MLLSVAAKAQPEVSNWVNGNKAIIIDANDDEDPVSNINEKIYFRVGKWASNKWYTDPQMTVAADAVTVGRPFYVCNGSKQMKVDLSGSAPLLQLKPNTSADWVRFSSSGSDLAFLPGADPATSSVAMMITKTGRVGIGTTEPATNFHIKGDNEQHFKVDMGSTNTKLEIDKGNRYFKFDFIGDDAVLSMRSNDPYFNWARISTNGGPLAIVTKGDAAITAPSMFIDKDGKVGIGTSSPVVKFHVMDGTSEFGFSAASNNALLSLKANSTSDWARIGSNGSPMSFFTNNTETKTDGTEIPSMVITTNRKVGIGTTAPTEKLDVQGGKVSSSTGVSYDATDHATDFLTPGFVCKLNITSAKTGTSRTATGRMLMNNFTASDHPFLNIQTLDPGTSIKFDVGGNTSTVMELFENQVLIGSHLPYETATGVIPFSGLNYALGVRGRIVSESLTCKALNTWGDFVFDESYKPMSLTATEQYIKANKHLPGVPSAKELEEKGVDVYDMLNIQMQKIEELTLHSIEQQKIISQQQALLEKLSEKVK
ncbi:hypothetical protein GCM10023092_26940 [Rurimicrobium arvi]|uniref:Tail fiber domain-containing protein n=2 Tax=Rurimicrobium arvi TaxID=2049916 RepID=A0ABP8N1X0_9BACT